MILPEIFPEPWASDWGEDEYGLFMGFALNGIQQLLSLDNAGECFDGNFYHPATLKIEVRTDDS